MKKLAVIVLLFCSLQVFGQDAPRHFDFTKVLNGIDGKPLLMGDPKSPAPMTLGDVAVNALLTQTQDDQRMTGLEKFKLSELAQKIYSNRDVTLTADELHTIVTRIGMVSPPAVVGPAWRLLDPAQK